LLWSKVFYDDDDDDTLASLFDQQPEIINFRFSQVTIELMPSVATWLKKASADVTFEVV
jgi:hypothetical protein